MKFGDILRYPDDQGVGDDILFLHLVVFEHGGMEYQEVMVLRTTEDDDQWAPGDLVVAGMDELIPYAPPTTRITIDGKVLSDEAVFAGIDFAAGTSATVWGIKDASGTFVIEGVDFGSPNG